MVKAYTLVPSWRCVRNTNGAKSKANCNNDSDP